MTAQTAYTIIDGRIDLTLGTILRHKPAGAERPKWSTVLSFVRSVFTPARDRAAFFLSMRPGIPTHAEIAFLEYLEDTRIQPVPLRRETDRNVVTMAITRMLRKLTDRSADVALVTHDPGHAPALEALRRSDPERKIAVLGFPEHLPDALTTVADLEVYDLEKDARAFTYALPRHLPSTVDDWDPSYLLD